VIWRFICFSKLRGFCGLDEGGNGKKEKGIVFFPSYSFTFPAFCLHLSLLNSALIHMPDHVLPVRGK
jgi:hypothetical protein